MTKEERRYYRTRLIVFGLVGLWLFNLVESILNMNLEVYLSIAAVFLGLTLWGCYLWTTIKNRRWAFMLWGLLAPIGLLGISLLKDKSNKEEIEHPPRC